MPRYTEDWESEYIDPISEAEDKKQAAIEERQNAEIMFDIELCRIEFERREFARAEAKEWATLLDLEQDLFDYAWEPSPEERYR